MTPRFVFRPAARSDLREARDWYEQQQPGLGVALGAVVSATLDRIAVHHELYPTVWPGVRRAVLSRFPYSIFYRVRANDVDVLAVFHHRRDPMVWQRRVAP